MLKARLCRLLASATFSRLWLKCTLLGKHPEHGVGQLTFSSLCLNLTILNESINQ